MTTSLFMVLRDNRAALYGQAEDLGRALAVGGGAARSWQGRRSRQIGRRSPLPSGKSLAELELRAPQGHITIPALVAKHGLLGGGRGGWLRVALSRRGKALQEERPLAKIIGCYQRLQKKENGCLLAVMILGGKAELAASTLRERQGSDTPFVLTVILHALNMLLIMCFLTHLKILDLSSG